MGTRAPHLVFCPTALHSATGCLPLYRMMSTPALRQTFAWSRSPSARHCSKTASPSAMCIFQTPASTPSPTRCATASSSKSRPWASRGCSASTCSSATCWAPGDRCLQVPDGTLPKMAVGRFMKLIAEPGPFRTAVSRYAQANMLQLMQGTACNALHGLEEQRCCRWLLQTHDRVGEDEFLLKHEFLAIMLGATRPRVTKVMGVLQNAGSSPPATDASASPIGRNSNGPRANATR